MENRNIEIIVTLAILILGVSLLFSAFYKSINEYEGRIGNITIIKTDCYDNFYNKILYTTCEKEEIKQDKEIVQNMVFGIIMLLISSLWIAGMIGDKPKWTGKR